MVLGIASTQEMCSGRNKEPPFHQVPAHLHQAPSLGVNVLDGDHADQSVILGPEHRQTADNIKVTRGLRLCVFKQWVSDDSACLGRHRIDMCNIHSVLPSVGTTPCHSPH